MAPTLPRPTSGIAPSSSASPSSSSDSNPAPIALSSSDDDQATSSKRRQPRSQRWLFRDEVTILTALAAERRESGRLPGPSALCDELRLDLKRENLTAGDVAKKVYNLRERFKKSVASGGPRDERRDRRLYELSVEVWPELLPPVSVPTSSSSSSLSSSSAGTE